MTYNGLAKVRFVPFPANQFVNISIKTHYNQTLALELISFSDVKNDHLNAV